MVKADLSCIMHNMFCLVQRLDGFLCVGLAVHHAELYLIDQVTY